MPDFFFSGQLDATYQFLTQVPSKHNEDLKQEIQQLLAKASRAANLSLPYIEARNPRYYNVFKSTVDKASQV